MSRFLFIASVLLALVGAAVALQCHRYQSEMGTDTLKDSTMNCSKDTNYCYKYVINGKDDKGKKYENIYEGCSGDANSPVPQLSAGIGSAATCDKDGKRAQSSGSSNAGSYEDAYYCCSKDSCNSAGYATAGMGLSLVTVAITALKFC